MVKPLPVELGVRLFICDDADRYFVETTGLITSDFNVRLIEMAHTNTVAMMDFAREVSTAKGPVEAVALCSSHNQKQ
jgi:hypothetical protein